MGNINAKEENPAPYTAACSNEDAILEQARQIATKRLEAAKVQITSADKAKELVEAKLRTELREIFGVLLLDSQHNVIEYLELFKGSINVCSVYPREIVKAALCANAATVILCHNHPSGLAEPSQADIRITDRVRDSLAMVDVNVLDHIVVGMGETKSRASMGLI